MSFETFLTSTIAGEATILAVAVAAGVVSVAVGVYIAKVCHTRDLQQLINDQAHEASVDEESALLCDLKAQTDSNAIAIEHELRRSDSLERERLALEEQKNALLAQLPSDISIVPASSGPYMGPGLFDHPQIHSHPTINVSPLLRSNAPSSSFSSHSVSQPLPQPAPTSLPYFGDTAKRCIKNCESKEVLAGQLMQDIGEAHAQIDQALSDWAGRQQNNC